MKEFELDIDTNSEKRAQKSKENVQSRSEEVNLESDRKEKTEGGRKTSNNGNRIEALNSKLLNTSIDYATSINEFHDDILGV
ncbi:21508_t:CDS:2 [Rhizophagus irregularis]|nr:21508_t:CDS:2 [Rhizophagus irregularis]